MTAYGTYVGNAITCAYIKNLSRGVSYNYQPMNDLLNNPAIQSGIIPLLIALVCAAFLKRFKGCWAGLSFAIAYYVSVYLTAGFQFLPFTSTRKILLLGIIAVVLGVLIDNTKFSRKHSRIALSAVAAAAGVWLIWPVMVRQEGLILILIMIAAMLYTGWLTVATNNLRNDSDRAAMIALSLGLGTGISAILGASALIGQLGIAIGAVAGAMLLLSIFNQNLKLGSTFTLPVGLLSGLLGIAAVTYASLPWYCLIPLAGIPLTTYARIPGNLTKIKLLLILAAITVPLPLISIALAWFSGSGEESMY